MSRIEKIYCILFLLIMIIYIPCFFVFAPKFFDIIFITHISMMFLSLVFMILVIKDIFQRDFPKPNAKARWILLMFLFPFLMFVYLFVHAFKPRRKLPQEEQL